MSIPALLGTSHLEIEEATLRAFIRPERTDRYVALLKSRKRREKLRAELHHLYDLDARYLRSLTREQDSAAELYALLRRLGAPEDCHLISASPEYDGAALDLRRALDEIHATGNGTLVSCVAGQLGYYEGEDDRYILVRR